MKKAQILVETIIGVGVVSLVLSAIVPLFLIGIRGSSESWKADTARLLAQESMEAAKSLKEENWNNLYQQNKGNANPYHLVNNAGTWVLAAGEETVSINNLDFKRKIIIDNVSRTISGAGTPAWQFGEIETSYNPTDDDPSTLKITADVSYENSPGIAVMDYFTRNKNSLWEQTDWSGHNYSSISTIFVPAGDIDTSTVGALKLGKIPGAVAHYGNEFVTDSVTTIYRLNSPDYRVSMRFTAQQSGNVNQLRIYIAAQQRGNQVFYKYGLQGNSGGNPDGSYISSPATANFSSTGWQTVNLGNPVSITAGSVYHLVIQYDSGSAPAANRYIDICSTLPDNLTIPLSGANDTNSDTLAYYGPPLAWHDRTQQPLYVLGFDDGSYEGNPYDARASRAIRSARFEGETFTLTDARSVSGVGLYVASSDDPLIHPAADNLYVTLVDLTDGVVLTDPNEIFVDPLSLTTSFDWIEHSFSSTKTLPAGHQFRLYFSSPGSSPSRNYLILNMSNPDASPYNDLNWDGINALTTRSTDSGATFTESQFIDLSYYLLVPGDQYAPNGELTSSTLDTGNALGAGYNRISWALVGALPTNTTVKMQLAANNDNATWQFGGPGGSITSWYTLSAGENLYTGLASNRYLRYKIRLETADPTVTPTVDWVRINWAY